MPDVSSEAIEQYYSASHESLVRDAERQDHFGIRHGYFTDDVTEEAAAIAEMRRLLKDTVGVSPGDRVLDVGCGFGDDAVWLADRFGADATGVNISEQQLSVARGLADERGVTGSVTFRKDDFHQFSTLDDDSFDVAWAVEALCHARPDEAVLGQISRVLDDGGRLVVADLFRSRSSDSERSDALRKACDGLLVNPESLDALLSTLESLGFESVECEDATDTILPSAKRYYWYGRLWYPIYRLKDVVLGGSEYEYLAASASGFRHQYEAIRNGDLTYAIVSARLPV